MLLRLRKKSILFSLGLALATAQAAPPSSPILSRVPSDGIQPQVLVDDKGAVHLLYFSGDAKAGDLYYARRPAGVSRFEAPLRVNSMPATAVAIGTIRGGQLALGRAGRVHVAWNGANKAKDHPGASMFYSRLDPNGAAFEPQRDLMTFTGGLDGGGSVTAEQDGTVYVAWHGIARAGESESSRGIFLARSRDDGQTFEPERDINPEPTGACACCGLKVLSNQRWLFVLYREAREGTQRDERLIGSQDKGETFRPLFAHPWKGTTCPMSSAWLAPETHLTQAAWENRGRIWLTRIDSESARASEPISPSGSSQKYPVTAASASGTLLVAWVEGAGWQKGGALCWQLFDPKGKALGPPGHTNGVPAWSFAAAWTRADEGFEIIY